MDITAITKLVVFILMLEIVLIPAFVYVRNKEAPNRGGMFSPIVFALSIGGAAIIGYVIGVPLGIQFACSMENAGNLCGLAGYFLLGPSLALIAALLAPIIVWIIGNRIRKSRSLDRAEN